jgi:hypothetical protein
MSWAGGLLPNVLLNKARPICLWTDSFQQLRQS